MVDEERSGGEGRAQGDIGGVDGESPEGVPEFVLLQGFREVCERVERASDKDARGGRDGKLEAGIPEDARLGEQDEDEGDPEAVHRVGGSLEECADLWHGEHEDGAAYGGGTACDGNVEEQQGDGDNPYGAQREPGRLEENHEDACEEDDMETADGENMHESGPLEIAAEGFGNAAPVAGEKAQQESGLGRVEVVGKT